MKTNSWIDNINENRRLKTLKIKVRTKLLSKLVKLAIDFPIDDQINSSPILGDSGSYSDSVPIGGELDEYLPKNDAEGRSPDTLNFGREIIDDDRPVDHLGPNEKCLNPKEPSLYGLSDGIESQLDIETLDNGKNEYYGTTDSGNTLYDQMWI